MAILKTYMFKGHNNIYKKAELPNYTVRDIRVETGMPEGGTNEDTGILFFISAYGATLDSHVFQRMRKEFCEQYNMITAQCDFFGNKYMNPELNEELKYLFSMVKLTELEKETLVYRNEISETEDEFNDMGIMQALDHVSSILCLMHELKSKHIIFNTKKIILFGTSHGVYLAYLVNAICPGLVSSIIDISAYLTPYYMKKKRVYIEPELGVKIGIEYFLKLHPEYRYNEKLYDLRFLYQKIENTCKIIAFQGKEDWMVDTDEKVQFISQLQNAEVMLIGREDVDGILCKNAAHGLGMDFFELFQMVMPLLEKILRQKSYAIELKKEIFLGDADNIHIKISYERGLPELVDISK